MTQHFIMWLEIYIYIYIYIYINHLTIYSRKYTKYLSNMFINDLKNNDIKPAT
jgi:hypothetical protein